MAEHTKKKHIAQHTALRHALAPETKQTHFRTWKAGKKWLYGSASLALLLGAMPAVTQFTGNKIIQELQVSAATSSSGTLVPGQTTVIGYTTTSTQGQTNTGANANTGNTSVISMTSSITNAGNTTITTSTANPVYVNWTSGTLKLATYQKNGNSWASYNNALNMTQPLSMTYTVSVNSANSTVGNWL
ncbi:MAG: KxYKxGKxW signal peptide domain-containing protein, partial [Streptococcaceae bacterium]|nr:KxYKxGKxW signal peptide domain-containing protein [Streptococcaceae bacterium]